jgi:hypothetical protein
VQGRTITDLYSSPHLVQIVKDHIAVGAVELTDGKYVAMWGGAHFMLRRQRGLNKIADAPLQVRIELPPVDAWPRFGLERVDFAC